MSIGYPQGYTGLLRRCTMETNGKVFQNKGDNFLGIISEKIYVFAGKVHEKIFALRGNKCIL